MSIAFKTFNPYLGLPVYLYFRISTTESAPKVRILNIDLSILNILLALMYTDKSILMVRQKIDI